MPAVSRSRSPRIHATAIVERGAAIGARTIIWHHTHVMPNARIGAACVLGQSCFVGEGVVIGNGCRVQNHVSLFQGVELARDVFVGPSAVFTNVKRPRAAYPRKPAFAKTRIGKGATIGANATILSGISVGAHAFIGAGAVVLADVPAHAVMVGTPAHAIGWICACGDELVRRRARPTLPLCERCRIGPGTATSRKS